MNLPFSPFVYIPRFHLIVIAICASIIVLEGRVAINVSIAMLGFCNVAVAIHATAKTFEHAHGVLRATCGRSSVSERRLWRYISQFLR